MKKSILSPILPLVSASVVLCGCASHYVIRLSNGEQIITASKPKVVGASYQFKDAKGRLHIIPRGRVQEVEPASMAREETKSFQQRGPAKPKHWYFLWLA